MIKDLDDSLKAMLAGEAAQGSELSGATISFGAPDAKWRLGTGLALDVYLYKLLENRELRANARRAQRSADGTVTLEQAPIRAECWYLVTAWNKAESDTEEREQQEHRLLSQVLYVLWRNPTLPRKYLAGALKQTQEIDLPIISAQSDDLALVPDFWTGFQTYLRPAITCRVTLSLDLALDVTEPMVTTAGVTLADGDAAFTIGGFVRAGSPVAALPDAWVRVNETGRVYMTDADGSFVIGPLARGKYTLTVRAVGYNEGKRPIAVPAPDGSYDVSLIPL